MTAEGFRRLALRLPEACEVGHMGHPDFRVGGRIFATLGHPDEAWGMVKLTPEQQEAFVSAEPAVFVPVKGGWGRAGATSVLLRPAKTRSLRVALATAWRNVAPRRLAEKAAGEQRGAARKRRRRLSSPKKLEPREVGGQFPQRGSASSRR